MTILLDNGHGQDTPGKRSPDGFFREYSYTRFLASHIQQLLISLHVNAAGNGQEWMNARGWSCYTTPAQTRADSLATALYEAAEDWLPGHRLRKYNTDGDPDIESNFYILRHSSCPAVSHLIAGVFLSRNWNLTYQEIPQCNEGNTCNHTDGHIPGESPYIATLQHYQRLL